MSELIIPKLVDGDDEHVAPTTTQTPPSKSRSQRLREKLMTPLGLTGASVGLVALTAGGTTIALRAGQEAPAAEPASGNPKNGAPAAPGNTNESTPTHSSGGFANISPVTVECMGTMIRTVSEGSIYLVTPVIEDSETTGGDPRTAPNVFTVLTYTDAQTGEDKAYADSGIGSVTYRPDMSATAPMLAVIDVSGMENPPKTPQEVQASVPFGDSLADNAIYPCPDNQLQELANQYGPQ